MIIKYGNGGETEKDRIQAKNYGKEGYGKEARKRNGRGQEKNLIKE